MPGCWSAGSASTHWIQRGEQLLLVNHRHHRKEHHQQGGEGHGVLERVAQAVLVGDPGKGGDQYDHQQADQPDLGHMQGQGDDQDQCRQPLHLSLIHI